MLTPPLPAIDTYPQPEKLADKYQTHTTGSPVDRAKWEIQVRRRRASHLALLLSSPASFHTHLSDARVDLQRFAQNVVFFLGFIAEVVTDPAKLNTLGPDGIYSIVVALDQLVAVQSLELGLFYCGLEATKED